jgi:hypothetical protein
MSYTEPAPSSPYNIKQVILILLAYKFLFFLTIYLSKILLPLVFNTNAMMDNFNWGQSMNITWRSLYKTWDATHYLYLSEIGYQAEHGTNAMYPLWPYIIRFGTYFTGDSLISALILSNIFSLAAFVLLHRLVFDQYGKSVADRSLILMLIFPGAIFFGFAYSESLFLLLCMLCIVFLYRNNFLAAAIISFFIPIVKAVGVFIIFPLAYALYKERFSKNKTYTIFLLLSFPILGYISYFFIMYILTGDAFSGFKAQNIFIAKSSILKLFDVPQFIQAFFTFELDHTFFKSIFDRIWFVFIAIGLGLIYKINRLLFMLSVPFALIPAIGTSFMSYTRYAAVIFPVFIAYSYSLNNQKWNVTYWGIVTCFGVIQLFFLIRHAYYYWVG